MRDAYCVNEFEKTKPNRRPSAGNTKFPVRDGQATKLEILNVWIKEKKN